MPDSDEKRLIRFDASMTEERAARLFRANVSPTEFAGFVLHEIPIDDWISHFKIAREGMAQISAPDVAWELATVGESARRTSRSNGRRVSVEQDGLVRANPWTKQSFIRFMDVIAASKDFESPLRLLDAYITLGPSPTSAQLKTKRGFTEENSWQQELRAAKARLTIFARRMGHPPLFPRAQTTEKGRMHPLDPLLYSWLMEWSQSSDKETVDRGEGEQSQGNAIGPKEGAEGNVERAG